MRSRSKIRRPAIIVGTLLIAAMGTACSTTTAPRSATPDTPAPISPSCFQPNKGGSQFLGISAIANAGVTSNMVVEAWGRLQLQAPECAIVAGVAFPIAPVGIQVSFLSGVTTVANEAQVASDLRSTEIFQAVDIVLTP